MTSSNTGKLSIREKGLRYNLLIIEFLVVVMPFLVLFYIFYRKNVFLEFSQIVLIALTLILILAGLIMIRQIFDKFSILATSIKKAEGGDKGLIDVQKDTVELQEITISFNNLMKKFEQTTAELQRRVFELFSIKELAEIASKSLDIDDLLNVLLEKAMAVSRAQIGSVFMVESETHRFRVLATRGLESGPKKGSYIDINESLARLVVSDKKPLLVQDIETDPRTRKPNDPKYGPPSFLSMPIFVRENLIAGLNLSCKETQQVFDSNDEHIVSIMISEIGFALENARLHSQVLEHIEILQERSVELTNANDQLEQEVTERTRMEEELEETNKFLRNILDSSSSISIVSTDLEQNVLFWNKGAENIFGYTDEEIVGRRKIDILYPDDETKKAVNDIRSSILKNKKETSSEIREVTKDGRKLWVNLNLTSRFDEKGNVVGILGIGEDITERKRAEEELRRHREQLEEMVQVRTADLQVANEELQREIIERKKVEDELRAAKEAAEVASRAKSDFLAAMSHELRTPLNAIIGFSEILRDQYFGNLNEKQTDYANDILQSGKHLLSLINDILDLSKVEAGKVELELSRVNMKELFENSLIMVKEKCMKHGINLSMNIAQDLQDLEITADERRLKQVMFNLLSNAAKFTLEGGAIRLEAERVEEELIINVKDTGIGIARKDQEKIFEEFYQLKGGLAGKTPGTGLGLSLVKRLVEMHGGRVWVESEGQGKGSRFSFALPIGTTEMEPSVISITRETTLLSRLKRAISLSKRHNRTFTLCRLHVGSEDLRQRVSIVKEALVKEKGIGDFLGMDKDGYIYLILRETGQGKTKLACNRLRTKMQGMIEGLKVSSSMATFPQDGKTAKALIKKASIS